MPRRAASITQADVARVIRAAKQAGAMEVIVPVRGGDPIIIRIAPSTGDKISIEDSGEIVL